jgi:ABC-type sugar transport system ATPase subunit
MASEEAGHFTAPLVRMRGISKRFGRNLVLREVDFDVFPGECHVLAGENGAGKSTLINILGGVVTSFEGDIEIAGRSVRPRSPLHAAQLGVAVIHQELSLIPAMSVADNLMLGQPAAGPFGFVSDRAQRRRAAGLLSRVGLELDVDRRAGTLPLAQQQLVEIAKALAFEARVIVMDEPTSALPADDVERVFALIARLKADGCGVVYISHKMDEIDRVADRITVLRDGARVGSDLAEAMPRDRLVRLMVGREIARQFPYEPSAAHQEAPPRLKVEGLTVRSLRGGNPPVADVSFDARGGEVLGLAGLQGSGNSDLLLGLFGAHGRRTQGWVLIDGQPLNTGSIRHAMRQGMALLTSDRKESGLVLSMSVAANVTLADLPALSPGGWRRPGGEREVTRRHAEALNLRAPSLEAEAWTLSGGNQQKVALAKWLVREPKVLLLDEPTRGVDVGAKREIYGLINQLKRRGVAIVMISTELPELLGLSDRVAVMHRGRISAMMDRAEATPEAVMAACMGEAGGPASPRAVGAVDV